MTKKTLFLLVTLFNFTLLISQNTFVRKPAISPDASKIAFSYHGDIWVFDLASNQPKRLTIHQAYESNPVWNSKSNQLVFTSNRRGSTNIFKTDLNGGIPNQLTYYPTTDTPSHWSSNGDIIFSSNRIYKGTERESSIYVVSEKGETPNRFMTALGSQASISPNGNFVAFVKGTCRISREDYTGPAQRDIWIYNLKTKEYHQITTSKNMDHTPLWDEDNNLYYIGAASGRYNIYKTSLNGNGSKNGSQNQLTNLKVDGVLSFSVSNNGTIIYSSGTEVFKTQNGATSKINLNLSTDNRFELEETKTVSNGIRDLNVSPNGKLVALSINGEIFVKENNKDRANTNNVSNHPFRDRNPQWISDKEVLFISDRDGHNEIYLSTSKDTLVGLERSLKIETKKLTNSKEDVYNLLVSPDHKKISYQVGRGNLMLADYKKGKITNIVPYSEGWAAPSGVSWSPDSKYLAYSQQDLDFDSEIFIQSVDNPKEKFNVSMHPRSDRSPSWSSDGKMLSFASNRSGNRGGIDYDIWMVWLKKEDWEKTKADWIDLEKDGEPEPKKPKVDKKDDDDAEEEEEDPDAKPERPSDRTEDVLTTEEQSLFDDNLKDLEVEGSKCAAKDITYERIEAGSNKPWRLEYTKVLQTGAEQPIRKDYKCQLVFGSYASIGLSIRVESYWPETAAEESCRFMIKGGAPSSEKCE